ncbi:MAG: nuclear transport factor 2 family protein [Gaiellaceae bacterium]
MNFRRFEEGTTIDTEWGSYREAIGSSESCELAGATFETYNARDWSGYQGLQHASVQWYEVDGRLFKGADGVTEEIDNWRDAYPDASADITNLVDFGEARVLIEWTLRGERRGASTGPEGHEIPEQVEVRSADLMQLRQGKVYAGRTYYDVATARVVEAVQGGLVAGVDDDADGSQYRTDNDSGAEVAAATSWFSTGGANGSSTPESAEVTNAMATRGQAILEWRAHQGDSVLRGVELLQLEAGEVSAGRTYYGLTSALAI